MKLEDIIYHSCGIDLDALDDGAKIDCRKVKVSPAKLAEIEQNILTENPKLTEHQVCLLLLQYGPVVEEKQSKDVILEEGYIC